MHVYQYQKVRHIYFNLNISYKKHPNRKFLAADDDCGKTIMSDQVCKESCKSIFMSMFNRIIMPIHIMQMIEPKIIPIFLILKEIWSKS